MRRNELDWAIDMAAAEGWNPGLHDADPFHAQDPGGFLIATLDHAPVGCISAVSYGGRFGFIGFYIVAPERRKKGYGMLLWNAAMDRLQGHVIGLDGVFEQQDNYRKSGFEFQYSNIRFEFTNTLHGAIESSNDITPASINALPEILTYERDKFPHERRPFLARWLDMPGAFAVAARKKGALCGYGLLRPCRAGYKIGPLFADTPDIADNIFQQLCARAEKNAPIYLDVPEVNKPGMRMAENYGMQRVFGTARMYVGATPQLNLDAIFGVTTFELG